METPPASPDEGPAPDDGPAPDPGPSCDCDDGLDCTVDTCLPDGTCEHSAKDYLCDDGDQCNGAETCDDEDGCQAGKALECDDDDVCNGPESCVPDVGCVAGESLDCGDGLPCNGEEFCHKTAGCQPGRPPAGCCSSNADCDNTDVCDGAETCEAETSTCVFGDALECDDADPCTGEEACDPSSGCQDGTPLDCDDGDPCNGAEICAAGQGCQAGEALVCDDEDPCNGVETCAEGQGCQAGEALDCDDADECNGAETCVAGQGCAAGTPLSCDDGDVCNGVETCDASAGCQDGQALVCDDGDVCNGAETCDAAGGCQAGDALVCVDADLCNGLETCDAVSGCQPGEALFCDDGDPCTGEESCVAEVGCQEGAALVCDDGDVCNGQESCLAGEGCQQGAAPVCGDGLPCNGTETCDAQAGCQAGTPPSGCCEVDSDCDDSDLCNGAETCDPATLTCVLGAALTCDDSNPCNGEEWCHPDVGCKSGAPLQCSDGEPCNGAETCLEGEGCQAGPALVCDDSNACNGVETCVVGAGCSTGEPLGCDDGDVCNGVETCDATLGCVGGTALTCDDGLPCNGAETCDAEDGCQAGTPPAGCCSSVADCDDGGVCNGVESCDPATNSCVLGTPKVCSDGDACNGVETCLDPHGSCQAGEPPVCADGNPCTTDECEATAGCTNAPNTLPCSDDNACTEGDACAGGACVSGAAPSCDDTDGCTVDACDSALGCTNTPDLTPPAIAVLGVEDGGTLQGPVTPEIEVSAGFATELAITLDGEAYEQGTAIAGDGPHVLAVTATGCDGQDVGLEVTFVLDSTPPVIEAVLEPPANSNGWNNTPVTVGFIGSDEHSKLVSITDPVVISAPGEGQQVVGTAVDAAGNEVELVVTVNTDFKAPVVILSEPQPNQPGNDQLVTSAASLVFKGSIGDDALSGFAAAQLTSTKLQAVTTFEQPGAFEVEVELKPGMNSIVVSATDQAGNAGTAALMVFADSEPPFVTIQTPSDGYKTTEAWVDVSGLAHDLVIGAVTDEDVAVVVNGIEAIVANGQFVVKNIPLELGANVIEAVATDGVGQVVKHTITVTRVDSAVKHLVIVSGNDQVGDIHQTAPLPLIVQLVDGEGDPIAGHEVLFAITSSDGRLAHETAKAVSDNARLLLAETDIAGMAAVNLELGTRAGAALDQVTISAEGALSSVQMHASASAVQAVNVHAHMGMNQVGRINTSFPEPLSVVVTDPGGNRVPNHPVTFKVVEGDGKFGGSAEVTVLTNSKGFADVVYTAGEVMGYASHLVEASIGVPPGAESVTELGASFVLSVFPPRNTTMTGIQGSVLDENDQPLAGVTIRFPAFAEEDLHTVQTDATGAFSFMDAPTGHVLLEIDGRTAEPEDDPSVRYPKMTFEVHLQEGVVTELPGPVYLLKLNKGQFVDGLFDVEFSLPEAPGFGLKIPAGTKVTFPDGSDEGVVSVTQVHFDQAPMAPVDGLQTRLLVTIQPPGVRFDPPAPLQLPNVEGYEPGRKVDMYSYDHDLEAFVPIGIGEVSDDGTVIRSDPGVGVVKGGWHCGASPSGSGGSAGLTAKLSVTPPKDPEVGGGFEKSGDTDGGTKFGIGGGGTYAIPPSGPAKLTATGSPGKDTHWEWCGSGEISVSGPGCQDQSSCEGTATPTGPDEGALGKARVLHICDETKECVQDTIDVVICNVPLSKKEFTFSAEKALPLGKWANMFKGWAEALGCDFGCSVHCSTGKACGDSCISKAKNCTWPPGTACDPGQTTPLKVKGELKVSSQDLCCPGCPDQVETNTDVQVSASISFAGDCATPWGINKKVGGFKLKIGLFVDFGLALSGFIGVQMDNCCPTPPCWCAKGGVGVTFTLGGSLKAVLDAPSPSGGLNLITATAGIGTGLEAKVEVDCKKICGTFGTLPVKAKLVFTVWNGMITILKKEFEILPAYTHGPDCVTLDLQSYAEPPNKGCPTAPPPVPEPSCACP